LMAPSYTEIFVVAVVGWMWIHVGENIPFILI